MSEISNNSQDNNVATSSKKSRFRSVLTYTVIAISLGFFSYISFSHWQAKRNLDNASQVQNENSNNDVFELSDEYKNSPSDSHEDVMSEVTIDELKEKGPEFIYQAILRQQLQINTLKVQISDLRNELAKYRNQDKLTRIAFAYVDFREKLFAAKEYSQTLRSFEIIAASDATLYEKVNRLKAALPKYVGEKKLAQNLKAKIPALITEKSVPQNSSLSSKIRQNIAQLVVIRKTDEGDASDIDGAIVKIQRLLSEKNYQEADETLLKTTAEQQKILADFHENLLAAIEINKIDDEIMNYLKSLE